MPVIIDPRLPAALQLAQEENIQFNAPCGSERPLHVGIVNLMPLKEMTERDLLRRLSASPLPVEVSLIKMASHRSRNTPAEHLSRFYKTFDEAASRPFDGLIFTGAPVENLPFEQVDYWPELSEMMDYARKNVRSSLYVCWAAFAGLYYHHGIEKVMLSRKLSGVFPHRADEPQLPLMRGMDDEFFVPHSRFATVDLNRASAAADVTVVSTSPQAGLYIAATEGGREIYITGHSEYAPATLDFEYRRDLAKGLNPDVPANYYRDDNPEAEIVVRWRSHSSLLFANWLGFYVNPRS